MKNFIILLFLLTFTSCSYKDLAKTLRYSDNEKRTIGIEDIRFQDLLTLKQGKACTYEFLHALPMFGTSSIIAAAKDGKINKVKLIGETGIWVFPFSKSCTVVYGD